MRYKSLTRVLALDLHPRRFGYVVLEGPDRLLDWGVRSYRRKGNSSDVLIQRRLRPLFDLWRPTFLVISGARQMPPRKNLLRERLLKGVVAEAKNHRILVRMLKASPGEDQGKRLTKYENARRVAEQFPALAQKLPPKRRTWESEDYRMSMFAAAAVATAYLSRQEAANYNESPQ
jgi:hypothetical protein